VHGVEVKMLNMNEVSQALKNAKQQSKALAIGVKQKTATTAIVLPCLLIKKMAWIIYPWGHLVHNVTHLPKNFKAT